MTEYMEIDADMLERAAEAVRNLIAQTPDRSAWAAWVPQHLDLLASLIRVGHAD